MTRTAVHLDIEAGIAWITLHGPRQRNALDVQAAADLIHACDRIDAEPSVGVAVITGSGRAFCSGADTAVLNSLRTATADEGYEGLDQLYAGFRRFGTLTVPTVAAVNGPAVGAGLNLALSADIRLASELATFVSGFAAIGLHPGGGHLHLLGRAAGTPAAAAAGVFAQHIDVDRAVGLGLVWQKVPDADLRNTVRDLVAHLAADPQLARALAADLHRTVFDSADLERAVEVERARQMWSLTRQPKEN